MDSTLPEGIAKWLAYTKPLIEKASTYEWSGPDDEHFFPFLLRAAIVRQTEALQTMLVLAETNHGHFGVTFLRPAFEELVWIEYLLANKEHASELVGLLDFQETTDSIKAQNEFAGAKTMGVLGFTQRYIKRQLAQNRVYSARVREIGRALGWSMDRSTLPSMAWLSRKVKREREYHFLYHATSRFVHFSNRELFRRVWGKRGRVGIGSSTFSEHWTQFALYWGFRNYLDLLIACHDEVFGGLELDHKEWKDIASYLDKFAQVPIITRGELERWSKDTQ